VGMRVAFLLLVLMNLAAFLWGAGYLRGREPDREPERLINQLNADKIKLMPPVVRTSCQRLNGLDAAALEQLRAVFAEQKDFELTSAEQVMPTGYWVAIPGLESAEVAGRKQVELRGFGINDAQVVDDARNGPFAVLIASFPEQARAQKLFDELTTRGVRSARLIQREPAPAKYQVRITWPQTLSTQIQDSLAAWQLALPVGLTVKSEACPGK
jgi:hypothetical protein